MSLANGGTKKNQSTKKRVIHHKKGRKVILPVRKI